MPTYALKCPKCYAVLRFQTRPEPDVAVFCTECGHCFDPPEAGKIDTPIVKAVPIQAPAPKTATPQPPISSNPVAANGNQSPRPAQSLPGTNQVDLFPSTAAKKPTRIKGSIFSWPLAVGLGCLLLLAGGILFFVVFDGAATLSALNPLSQRPGALAATYIDQVQRFEELVNGVSEGDKPDWSQSQLEQLAEEVEDVGIRVAKLLEVEGEEVESLRQQLTPAIEQRAQLAPKLAEYEDRYRSYSPINIAIRRIDQAGQAIEQQLTEGLVKLPDNEKSLNVVIRGIQIERRLVRSLAEVNSSEGIAAAIESTQAFSDRLNELAEDQASGGERIGLIPRDFKNAESAAATLRGWLEDVIKARYRPSPEFSASLKDFAQMETRFDSALFMNSLEKLGQPAATRVAAILAGSGGIISSVPKETDLAQNDTNSDSRARSPFADSGSSNPFGDSRNGTGSNSLNGDSSVPNVPGWGKSSAGGSENSKNSAPAARRDPGPNDPFGIAAGKANDPPSGNSTPSFVADPLNPFGSPAQLSNKELQTLQGPNVIVIRVDGAVPGGDLNVLRRQLATKLQCRRSSSDENSSEFVISLDYSGSLADVVKLIDFGTVDISDSQSRTIFATANERK